jgi:hypothetical protein
VLLPELADAYAQEPARWIALQALLDAGDARVAAGGEVETGWILASLLFPVLSASMGFGPDGRVHPRRGPQVRELAEPLLRPLALRLRVSRRDQEHARQILLALQRMVPARQPRRALVHSLTRRPAFPDALATLCRLGEWLGGDVAEAAAFWTEAAAGREPAAPSPAAGAVEAREGGRRRGRRRGGRGRRRGERGTEVSAGESAAEPEPAAVPQAPRARRTGRERAHTGRPEARPGMPPPWDDDYFFAALPTVPDLGEGDPGDRYGARTIAAAPDGEPAPEPVLSEEGAEPADTGARRRRRRRPRRRRPAGEPGGTAD